MGLGPIRGTALARPALSSGGPVKGAFVGLWAAAVRGSLHGFLLHIFIWLIGLCVDGGTVAEIWLLILEE